MDDIAFDRLTRLLSSPQPRRGALRAALASVLCGALIGRSPDALADDGEDELTDEALAGGRGALGNVGGGSGGNKRGSNRRQGKNRGGDGDHKRKRRDKCAKAGELRKDGKPCCKGLDRDSADRCIKRQPAGGSAGGCDPKACPSDPSTGNRGFCCPGGFCSCNNTCCAGPDCWISTPITPNPIDTAQLQAASQEMCAPPSDCTVCPNSDVCCFRGCALDGGCIEGGQRGGATIRRRPR